MKTTINKPAEFFRPCSITITFETQKELDTFGALCNNGPLLDALYKTGGNLPDYETMKELGADVHNVNQQIDNIKKFLY